MLKDLNSTVKDCLFEAHGVKLLSLRVLRWISFLLQNYVCEMRTIVRRIVHCVQSGFVFVHQIVSSSHLRHRLQQDIKGRGRYTRLANKLGLSYVQASRIKSGHAGVAH